MEKLKLAIIRIKRRTRRVKSGTYPLYRLIAVSAVVSAILQMSYKSWPASFESATQTEWMGWIFSTIQLLGGLSIWGALHLHDDEEPALSRVQLSLSLERTGVMLLMSVVCTYTYGVIQQNGGPPKTWATLSLVAFLFYLVYRFIEIGRALRELRSE